MSASMRGAQDDNSWTPNGTAIAILGWFFKSGELVRDFWTKDLRAWVRSCLRSCLPAPEGLFGFQNEKSTKPKS